MFSCVTSSISDSFEQCALISFQSVIKSSRMKWVGHVAGMREGRNLHRVLVGKSEGERPLGRPRRRWENGIKLDFGEIVWGVWSGFTWLRRVIVGGLL
jgi:hypothetical protein